MPRYIGLDVHKREISVCLVGADGEILGRERIAATREAIAAFAERLGAEDRVALEATTNTWPVVRLLRPSVATVVVANPLRTKLIAEAKVKTDKVDAHALAQLLRVGYLPVVWQPDADTEWLRGQTSRRAALVQGRTAIKNRIHAVLHQRLIHPPVKELFSHQGRAWLAELELDAAGRASLDGDVRLLGALEREIAELETTLYRQAAGDPRLKLLLTIPGVDVVCAQTLLAALGDLSRFRDADHAASYLGLVPSTHQSGEHCYRGPITKAGNSHARWVLVQAAQHLATHPGPLGVFFRRLATKKNRNVAVVATARKLVVVAYYLLTKGEPYRYAQPAPTAQKLRRLRLRGGGARRRTGSPKGTKCVAKLPGGSRTIPALDHLYAVEAVPPRTPAPAAERRVLGQVGLTPFAASLDGPRVLPRRKDHRPEDAS
jgi:transposase